MVQAPVGVLRLEQKGVGNTRIPGEGELVVETAFQLADLLV